MNNKEDLVKKLGEIAADLSSISDLQALDKTVTKIVDSIVEVEYWGLYFNDKKSDKFVMLSSKGFSVKEIAEAEKTAKERHPGWVFCTKQMLYIKDTAINKSGNSIDSKRDFKVRSRLWLPVVSNDEAIGAFGFASIYPNHFNQEHISTLSFVCNLAGVVYNNLQLLESKKEQNLALTKANKNLVEINNSLDSFAYRITHDLRSPATNVKGLITVLNYLLAEKQTAEVSDVQLKLAKSIDILLEKLEGFVELLKLESLNENRLEECNLKEVVSDTINQLTKDLNSAGGTIKIDYSKFNYQLLTIKEYITSIFFNIIQNSIKYKSKDRKLVITVKSKKLENYIEIAISDNGEGIEKQYFDKVFTMFTRFSRKSTVGGSGIGLYIVKKQIDKIKGQIALKSTKGVGTEFTILLSTRY